MGSFEMVQCLGRGGFGEVYLANHTSSGLTKRVAVKVLKTRSKKGSQALERMRDEARMLAVLDHPAILTVHELTRLAGRVALVAEFVDGVDLARVCQPERLLPPRVVMLAMAEVAAALHCAWVTPSPDTGEPLRLVHRDVKPENIRLSKHGEVKLLDFGIARTEELGREALTATGQMPFTPGYTPPEMFGEKPSIGDYTDVYALGATTFRLLTGERFFEGVKLKQQVNLAADQGAYDAYLRERLEAIPGNALRQLLWCCLAFRREERPSAELLAEKLNAIGDAMEGPNPWRWARSVQFPPPSAVEGASLTGQTLEEDDHMTVRIRRLPTREEEVRSRAPATVLLQLPSKQDLTAPPRRRSRVWMALGLAAVLVLVFGPIVVALGATLIGAGVYVYVP